jgi:hypothetical protein
MKISQILKDIATNLGEIYLRATPSDANNELQEIEVGSKVLCIYSNHPSVEYNLEFNIKALYPLQIQFLKIADFDDNTVDSDLLIDICREEAEKFAIGLINYQENFIFPDGFTIDPFDTIKVDDSILTGVTLNINFEYTLNC